MGDRPFDSLTPVDYLDAMLQEAVEHLIEGFQVIGFDWTFRYVNQSAARHGQRRVEDLLGCTLGSCYPGIEQTPLFTAMQRVMRARRPEQLVNEFAYPSGERRWFELRIAPVSDGICVFSIDITEQRVREQELVRSQKLEAIGRLVGGVAHDFNNLLTAILGYSEFALDNVHDPQAAEDIREIQKAGARAARLTRQLLALSRKPVQIGEGVDLPELLDELHPMLQRLMPDVDVVISHVAPAFVKVDAAHLEQIVLNLAVNARDAMPEGGRLRIEADVLDVDQAIAEQHDLTPGLHAVLTVQDTGCGMDADVLSRAFEPFFTTKGPLEGTGLGLSTVQSVVQLARGFIEVESELGMGTTFRLYLPVAESKPCTSEPTTFVRSQPVSETILIVEPEEAVRELMRKTLTACGYRVLAASAPARALTMADQADSLHLLITDLRMRPMHGAHLAQQIVLRHPETRVLYVSGIPDVTVMASTRLSARIGLLPKPFTPGVLIEQVRHALDR